VNHPRLAATLIVLSIVISACSSDTTAANGPGSGDDRLAVRLGEGFDIDGSFDSRMTCDGSGDYSPPLVFGNVPRGTTELVLSMVDDDETGPGGGPRIYWVQWAIPADAAGLTEHVKAPAAREALTDLGEATYNGPCPPPGATHHYRFTLQALSAPLDLPYGAPARAVLAAARQSVIETATTTARYRRRPME
jgi:hypothetical protein